MTPEQTAAFEKWWQEEGVSPMDDHHTTALAGYAAALAGQEGRDKAEIPLNIIRNWPEGFDARLQHVWLDVVSFIPNVKLYDLQRTLAEYGYTMKVYEATKPDAALADEGGV